MAEFSVNDYIQRKESETETVEAGPSILPVIKSANPKGSLFDALMRQENSIGSFFTNRERAFWGGYKESDPNFKWEEHIPQSYLEFAPRFAGAMSQDEIDTIRFNIDLENKDKALIGQHPIQSIFTGFIVNALDPTSLLPGTALYKGAKANLSALRSAMNSGSAALVSTIGQESALRATQYNRSLEESGINLLATTLLGTAIGGLAGSYLHTPAGKRAVQDIAKVLDDGQIAPSPKVGDTPESIIREGESAGAAHHAERTLEGEGIELPKAAEEAYAKTLARLSPLTRGLTSPFKSIRSTVADLLQVDMFQKKNSPEMGFQETKHALETLIRHDRMKGDKALADYEDIFYEMNGFKKGEFGRSVKHFVKRDKTISWDEFGVQTYLAIIRNGHENPQIQRAGFLIRDQIFEPWKEKMIEIGELPPNVEVKTALGYFTRMYNIDKINDPRYHGSWEVDDPATLYTIIKKYILRMDDIVKEIEPEVRKKIQAIEEELKNHAQFEKEYLKRIRELAKEYPQGVFNSEGKLRKILETDLEAKTTIENIIDNIRGLNDGRYNNPFLIRALGGAPKSTKNRHFLIPDEEIMPFLVTSPSKVVPMFLRGTIPHYHLTKWAKENGFDTSNEAISGRLREAMTEYKEQLRSAVPPKEKEKLDKAFEERFEAAKDKERPEVWTPEFKKVQEEYIEELKKKASPKYAAKLTEKFKEGEADIRAAMELLLGIYGHGENIMDYKSAKFAKQFQGWNYIRMMGYMVISSLTDPGSIVAKNGIGRFVQEGIKPIVAKLESAKHNKRLLQDMMFAMESYRGHRLKSFADQAGLVQETGLFGKTMHYLTQGFNNLSLMSYWTDMMQYITGNVSISRTLRAIDNYMNGKANDKEIKRVVNLGISTNEFKKIHEQWKAHGGEQEGSYHVNWGNWDTNSAEGLKALESFKLALMKDINATIITPSLGDKPLFAHTLLGSILFQFKSFAFAATNKILISGLQRRDAEFAQGLISLLVLGELSYITSRLLKNQPIDEDPSHLLYEAIDRSGILGILMEVPLTLQKTGLLPGGGTSRYSSRGWLGALGGPTLGTVEDITYLLNRFKNADETPLTDKDSDRVLKLWPANNIWYVDGINRNLGLSKSFAQYLGFEATD